MLALLWRAVRWRRATSLAVLAAAVVATAAGTLGPLYARSAEESLLRQRVTQAPAVQVGLTVQAQLGGPGRLTGDLSSDPTTGQVEPPTVADAARSVALDRRLDRWFGPPSPFVELGRTSLLLAGGSTAGLTAPQWLERSCEGLRMDSGAAPRARARCWCPRGRRRPSGSSVGSAVGLDLGSPAPGGPLRVAGIYADLARGGRRVGRPQPDPVGGAAHARRRPAGGRRARLPRDITDRTLPGAAGAYRPLRRGTIDLETAGRVTADVAAVDRDLRTVGGRPPGAVPAVPPPRCPS